MMRHLINIVEHVDLIRAFVGKPRDLNEGIEPPNIKLLIKTIEHKYGVVIDCDFYENGFHILDLNRRDGPSGAGRKAMMELCSIADRYALTITLVAAEGHPKLIRYYMSFGFNVSEADDQEIWMKEHEQQWNQDVEDDEDLEGILMVRKPL